MSITIQDLLEAGIHFGHQTRYWNPKMSPYIFGARNKIHIINLEKTLPMLQSGLDFLSDIASKKGKILFVGTKYSARQAILENAEKCKMPYINYRWLGGTLTNYRTIRHSIKRLKGLEAQFEKEEFYDLTKKEILDLSRQKDKLERALGGIKEMKGLPDALFVIDVGRERTAVLEAKKLRIPVIGVVDTNNDPDGIDYVIPGNDDSVRAINLYLSAAAESVLQAKPLSDAIAQAGGDEEEFVEINESDLDQFEESEEGEASDV